MNKAIEALQKLRNDPKLWKAGGAGGQDKYAGLPPGMRLVDEAIADLEIAKIQVSVLSGEACKEERAAGNGGCGICPWCARESFKRAEAAELALQEAARKVTFWLTNRWTVSAYKVATPFDIKAAVEDVLCG